VIPMPRPADIFSPPAVFRYWVAVTSYGSSSVSSYPRRIAGQNRQWKTTLSFPMK